jgi:ubiquinone biosynthesis protein COQ4
MDAIRSADAMLADIPPAPPPRRREWRRALAALRQLLADLDRTEKAFEIFQAIDGASEEHGFQRFLADPVGRRLLSERPALIAILCDRDALARMPTGSFGRAYLEYLERSGLDPAGLLQLKANLQEQARARGEEVTLDPAREWYRDRSILMHDLWHVLTGYGTDELGEAALLPFSWAQLGGVANAFLVFGVAARGTMVKGAGLPRYLVQAWRRGRRARWLAALPYEELLAQPLEEVRRAAAIDPGATAHPGGVLRGSWRLAPLPR